MTAPPPARPAPAAPRLIDADPELEAWKQARKGGRHFPWRQLSLMASLCFAIASFVLPAAVNNGLNWILYALAAAGFVAGIRKRRMAREHGTG